VAGSSREREVAPAIVGSSIGPGLSQHAGQLLRPYDATSGVSGAASEIGAHAATVQVQLGPPLKTPRGEGKRNISPMLGNLWGTAALPRPVAQEASAHRVLVMSAQIRLHLD